MTCRSWLKGRCPFEGFCKFAHRMCRYMEPKHRGTCKFWELGHCNVSEEICSCYHCPVDEKTGRPPGEKNIPQKNPMFEESRFVSTTGSKQTHVQSQITEPVRAATSSNAAATKDKSVTCRRWFKGACKKSSQECQNAHARRDRIEPKVKEECRYWQSGCQFTDAMCLFYHQPLDPLTNEPTRPVRFQTCQDWKTGTCPNHADRCPYFHEYFDPFSQEPDPSDALSRPSKQTTVVEHVPDQQSRLASNADDVVDTDDMPVDDLSTFVDYHAAEEDQEMENLVSDQQDVSLADQNPIIALCEYHLDLNAQRLFASINGKEVARRVLLLFPPSLKDEITLITSYLHAVGATVLTGDMSGAWSQYISNNSVTDEHGRKQDPSGVILYHPSIFNYWEFPSFLHTLANGHINHFQLGIDQSLLDHPEAANAYKSVRLFPTGDLVLLTDDLLQQKPAQALSVIDAFIKTMTPKPRGARNERLVFRPGMLAFVSKLMDVSDQQDVRVKLYLRIISLIESERKDGVIPGSRSASFVSLPAEDAPAYAGLWEADERKATDWLVNWFAGWCVLQRERFGRFTVVSGRSGEAWAKKYQHINAWTPEKYVSRRKTR